jgi:hypothetical protein
LGAPTALANLFLAAACLLSARIQLSDLSFSGLRNRGGTIVRTRTSSLAPPIQHWEETMGHLILQGDNTTYPGFSLLGEPSLAITMDETGFGPRGASNTLAFLVLSGTTSVSIASTGAPAGNNFLDQLEETTNGLTTVTISGSEFLRLGSELVSSNLGDGVVTDIAATAAAPTTIHSSLKLIDASAATGNVAIFAGATNTSNAGLFENGESLNANVTITYTGLTIKGGSGSDIIENDAKNGIVIDGNGFDQVFLGGAGAKATLGTASGDIVRVGFSELGTSETAGSALGDSVKFGAASTAELIIFPGAEAGSTASTASIGLTKVLSAADGMGINFADITHNTTIADETAAVASSTSLTAAEDAAVKALGSAGVAYFTFGKNEYFIATNNVETTVSSNDAIVELVGITDIHHATNSGGFVTLHF